MAVVRKLQSWQPKNQSIPSRGKRFFSSTERPDWHTGPPGSSSKGTGGSFPGGNVAEA